MFRAEARVVLRETSAGVSFAADRGGAIAALEEAHEGQGWILRSARIRVPGRERIVEEMRAAPTVQKGTSPMPWLISIRASRRTLLCTMACDRGRRTRLTESS